MNSLSFAATRIGSPFQAGEHAGTYITTKPASEADILALAQKIALKRLAKGPLIDGLRSARQYFQALFAPLEYEVFGVLFVDQKHQVIQFEPMFRGTLASASVHPREVVKLALQLNAAAVLFTHNHPSGNSTPSDADKKLTSQLQHALQLIDVTVLDHVVVSADSCYSFAEHGLL